MRRILNLLVDTTSKAFEATILGPIFQVDFVPGAPSAAGTSPPYIPEAKRPQFGQTDNRLLYIQFTCKSISTGTIEAPAGSPTAHGITNLKVQLAASEGDTYTILGGERMDGTANNNIFSSLIIDFTTDPNVVSMKGYFPMTRYSEPSMYIRTNCQNGLETSVLQSGAIAGGNALIADVITSDILGKINRYTPAGNSEFITYNSQSDEFFITLQQRKLTNLRIFLTDSKGRKLGRPTPDNDNSGTAAGLENTLTIALLDGGTPSMVSKRQSELGNLFFTAVIRIDVVKTSCPNQLQSEVFSPPYPGSKSGGILPFTSFAERPILRK
jgi:hypothetical protein